MASDEFTQFGEMPRLDPLVLDAMQRHADALGLTAYDGHLVLHGGANGPDMSDTTAKVHPALTPEQWAEHFRIPGYSADDKHWEWVGNDSEIGAYPRHGLAAIALLGKPYGFTQSMADVVHRAAAGLTDFTVEEWEALRDAADRIAALLPPRQ